jgi:TIR domain
VTASPSNPNYDVFLCHNSKDAPIVRRLAERLKENGVKPWIDESTLSGGSRWQDEIVNGLDNAKVIAVCLGHHDIGRWQAEEINVAADARIEREKVVVPLILPNCGQHAPQMPRFLKTTHCIDFRSDAMDADPYGRLLTLVDGRDPVGHHRPSVLVLHNKNEPTSLDARDQILSECRNILHRVRFIEYSEPLLEKTLRQRLEHSDLLVSLLAPDSYQPFPGEAFFDGIAAGASRIASQLGAEIVSWRAETMPLPHNSDLAKPFRATTTETWLPSQLAKSVIEKADARFARRRIKAEAALRGNGKHRAIFGYPLKGRKFVRQVTDCLKKHQISCDAPPKWDLLLDVLKEDAQLYNAFVVILTGDDEED